MLGIESGLEQEEINDGLKKAFIALQTKDRRGFESNYDQISQLLQLGKVDGQFIRENNELLKETMETIYGEIIPESQLTEKVLDAFKERSVNRLGSIGKVMANQVMLYTSGHLSQKIESLDMYRDKFNDLLEMYVNESWENHDTYNSFIRGFGNSFDDFSE